MFRLRDVNSLAAIRGSRYPRGRVFRDLICWSISRRWGFPLPLRISFLLDSLQSPSVLPNSTQECARPAIPCPQRPPEFPAWSPPRPLDAARCPDPDPRSHPSAQVGPTPHGYVEPPGLASWTVVASRPPGPAPGTQSGGPEGQPARVFPGPPSRPGQMRPNQLCARWGQVESLLTD